MGVYPYNEQFDPISMGGEDLEKAGFALIIALTLFIAAVGFLVS